MEIINQNNNFQNSENGTGQDFTNANIINQINNIITSKIENFNQEQKNKINQDKYLKNFKDAFKTLVIDDNHIDFSNYGFNLDFYFNFLVSLANTNKIFDFSKNLNKFLSKYSLISQEEQSQYGIHIEELLLFLNENSEEKIKKEDLQKSINDSNTESKVKHTSNILSFIETWEDDMYLFIHYLIETDFELFMTSGDEILEYHAIGFLVYYYSYDDVKNELSKVKVIYDNFKKGKINTEIIKNIVSNEEKYTNFLDNLEKESQELEDCFLKKYRELPDTIFKFEKNLDELNKLELQKRELKAQQLEIKKKFNQIKKEIQKI